MFQNGSTTFCRNSYPIQQVKSLPNEIMTYTIVYNEELTKNTLITRRIVSHLILNLMRSSWIGCEKVGF